MLEINDGIVSNGYVLIPFVLLTAWILAQLSFKYNWKIKDWF